ncbi:MAG TPA: flagellar hook-associated protein FlgL [Acidocella sp.]|nr:flagellar hook-associated protein FlgL [Acidocella sp.]HQU04772.1 flagellar hook-associated protein FlgL [Acidocella sp.]
MQSSFYTNFSSGVAAQETQLATLQQQISTGLAVQTPDQNPAAFQTATLANDQINALSNNINTQATIQTQLGSVNDVYHSVSTLFNNVQSVLEQVLNGTTNQQNLQSLGTQIQAAQQQLVGLGNTSSANGTYLFGGSRGSIPPFQTGPNQSVLYLGDGGQSQAAIAPDVSASTIANGDAFTSGLSGNGFASVAASSTNSGTGVLIAQGITNPVAAAAFQAGSSPITLSIAAGSSGLTYTASQSGSTISSGAVTDGGSIQLSGLNFQINGTAAAGDSFTISPSRPQSSFTLLQNIYNNMTSIAGTPAQAAQTRTALNDNLASLAQYQQTILTAQAQTGVTLQAIANAATSDANQQTSLQSTVQNAVGANTATAITQLDQTSTAIQAAMKAFASVQSLDLFKYL